MNTRPFTLLELLVVIVIIMVLATLLLPSLIRTRTLAKEAVCLSNLRQIGLGLLTYTGDFDNYLPPADLIAKPETTPTPRWNVAYGSGWVTRLGAGQYVPTSANQNRYRQDIFSCPLDSHCTPQQYSTDLPWWSNYKAIDVMGWYWTTIPFNHWAPGKVHRLPAQKNPEVTTVVKEKTFLPLLIDDNRWLNGMINSPWDASFQYPATLTTTAHTVLQGGRRPILFHDFHLELGFVAWNAPVINYPAPQKFYWPGAF